MVVKADITIDIDKQIGDLQNLTGLYNARVGDTTPLTIQWYKNGIPLNVQGLHAFITGHVGDGNYNSTTDTIDFPRDTPLVQASDDGRGTLTSGLTTLLIPKQMWQKSGIFSGYVGLKSNSGAIYTGKNIWFKVLGNVLESGIEINYFVDDFEKALSEANGKLNEALEKLKNNYDREVADHEKALIDDTTQLRKLAQDVGELSSQISANNIVKKSDYDKDIEEVKESINLRLSKMNTNPIGVPNSEYLFANYPDGADGLFITADTGHKWLCINHKWTDCGQYQALGIDNNVIDPIRAAQLIDEEKIDINANNINKNVYQINQNATQIKENQTDIESIKGTGQLKSVYITDQKGNYFVDQYGNRITGEKWLIRVDKTLTKSDMPADAGSVGNAFRSIDEKIDNLSKFDATQYKIPVLYLYGNKITSLKDKTQSLENEVTYKFPKYNVQGTVKKFKVQGSSSAYLPKKNYTLNLDQDFIVFPHYGKQHKYVIKANMNDFSQARNVVNAKIWGKVRSSRISENKLQDNDGNYLVDEKGNHIIGVTDPQLAIGGTYGAVDGFPIAVYVNDKYWGLYSFNIPKDDWMAKMPSKQGYAIVDTTWMPQGAFTKNTNFKDSMELQFCGTKNKKWAMDSINKLIDAAIAHYDTKETFDAAILPLLDVDSAIDYFIYSLAIDNVDGIYRNYLLQTFNGTKWYFAAYDLDETYGRTPQLSTYLLPNREGTNLYKDGITVDTVTANNRLFYQLWKFHSDEIKHRMDELLNSSLSIEQVDNEFTNYEIDIPDALKNEEAKIWPSTPETSVNNIDQIGRWYTQRFNFINEKYLGKKN